MLWGRFPSKIVQVIGRIQFLAGRQPRVSLSFLKPLIFRTAVPSAFRWQEWVKCLSCFKSLCFPSLKAPPASQPAPGPALLSGTVQTGDVPCHKHVVPFCQSKLLKCTGISASNNACGQASVLVCPHIGSHRGPPHWKIESSGVFACNQWQAFSFFLFFIVFVDLQLEFHVLAKKRSQTIKDREEAVTDDSVIPYPTHTCVHAQIC